jgi:hypothetical protein
MTGSFSTWTKSANATYNAASDSYNFLGSGSFDYLRIPTTGVPYPVGENMEIRLRAIINSQVTGVALYMLGRWTTVSGQGELCLKRAPNGTLQFDIGPISESTTQTTSTAVPIGTPFEIYWRRYGSTYYAEFNGVNVFNYTIATQRQCANDYVIGAYQASGGGTNVSAGIANWTLLGLKINRLTS